MLVSGSVDLGLILNRPMDGLTLKHLGDFFFVDLFPLSRRPLNGGDCKGIPLKISKNSGLGII